MPRTVPTKGPLTLDDLMWLIRQADRNSEGCSVTLFNCMKPPAAHPPVFGQVTHGMGETQVPFDSARELRAILRKLGRKR